MEKALSLYWERFIQLLETYNSQHYHLLFANLDLAQKILIKINDLGYIPPLEDIKYIKTCLLTLGQQADETTFRDYLHINFINEFIKIVQLGYPEYANSIKKDLKEKLPNSLAKRLTYKFFYSFKKFSPFGKEYQTLAKMQRGRLAALEENETRNRYTVFVDIIVSYIKALISERQIEITSEQLKYLAKFIEDLWMIALNKELGCQDLWHYLLPLQQTLIDPSVFKLLPNHINKDTIKYWQNNDALGVLALHRIAYDISISNSIKEIEEKLNLAIELNLQLNKPISVKLSCILLKNNISRLNQQRKAFDIDDVFLAQKAATSSALNLLNDFINAATDLLGEAPCDFAFCILGSSSRNDRRPYSDVEFVFLYESHLQASTERVRTYIYQLICLVELAIKCLNESHKKFVTNENTNSRVQNAGFHIDSSSHLLEEGLFGTPKDIVDRFIKQAIKDKTASIHPWLDDTKFYSLLSPKVINSRFNSDKVIKHYQQLVNDYLERNLTAGDDINSLEKAFSEHFLIDLTQTKLVRRQVLALSCLYDVLNKSKNILKPLDSKEIVINIKEAFYKPLTYLALNLKLYQGINSVHPVDIINEVAATLPWEEDAVVRLMQTALRFITQLQVKLHLHLGYQEEEIIWLGDQNKYIHVTQTSPLNGQVFASIRWLKEILITQYENTKNLAKKYLAKLNILSFQENNTFTNSKQNKPKEFYQILAPVDYAILDLIKDSLILPLAEYFPLYFNKPENEFKEILSLLLKKHLKHRNLNWFNKWIKHPTHAVKFEELINHPLIAALANYPSPNGWSPNYEHEMIIWLEQVQALTSPQKSSCVLEGVESTQKFYLLNQVVNELFNNEGEFIGNIHHSNQSKVSKVMWQIPGQKDLTTFYFKVKRGNEAGLMSREFAVINLHQLLRGQSHLALGWPLKLTYSCPNRTNKTYFCWISKGLSGDSLTDVMRDQKQYFEFNSQIDLKSYTHLFITHYLTCPEDAQPENFKVLYDTFNKKHILYGLDVGQSFVSPNDDKRKVLSVKTMLYLLDHAMHQPLSKEVLANIMLLDPIQVLYQWQGNLQHIDKILRSIGSLSDVNKDVQNSVKERLKLLSIYLYSRGRQTPSGLELLKALDPALALSYQSLLGKVKRPEDFYAIDVKAYVKNPNTGKIYSSTTYQQIQSQTLTPERLQSSLNLGEEYFASIDFRHLKDEADQRYMLAMLLAAIDNKKRFTYLNLSGCTILTEEQLIDLLQKIPDLNELHLAECSNFNLSTLFELLSFKSWGKYLCPDLKKLSISIDSKIEVLNISLASAERIQLAKYIMQWQQQFKLVLDKLLNLEDKDLYEAIALSLSVFKSRISNDRIKEVMLALTRLESKININQPKMFSKTNPKLFKKSLNIISQTQQTLLWLENGNWTVVQEAAVQLGQLSISIKAEYLNEIATNLIKKLDAASWQVRRGAVMGLGQIFSPQVQLRLLQKHLITKNVTLNIEPQVFNDQKNTNILLKLFSFLDKTTLLRTVPQVNKNWHHWQKFYMRQLAELDRTQHTPFLENNNQDEEYDFERSLRRFTP